jgi:prepilin-type N-terminal cleavage/methylation domain-containing protein
VITALHRRFGGEDRGSSLTELLVTMMVFAVILTATGALTIGFMRANAQTVNLQDQVDGGRTAVEAMTRTLRTAVMPNQLATCTPTCNQDAFVAGQNFSVKFYANINNAGNAVGPSQVTYTVITTGADKGKLIEKIQVPDPFVGASTNYLYCDADLVGATPACKARVKTRVIARGVQVGGPAVFTYYKPGAGTPLTPGAGGLSSDDLSSVLAVELAVTVQVGTSNKAAPTTYIQRITLPNAQSVLRKKEAATP